MPGEQYDIKRSIACADIYELLYHAFKFPTQELAYALYEGSYDADLVDCITEVRRGDKSDRCGEESTDCFSSFDSADELYDVLRKEYSRLYLSPGDLNIIFPYEGPFLFEAQNREGTPGLFRTPTAIDVEKQMREAGIVPKNARTEPIDSMFNEFEFMMYLYAQYSAAIMHENSDEELVWAARITAFEKMHILNWVPIFLKRTVAEDRSGLYACLAQLALCALKAMYGNVEVS